MTRDSDALENLRALSDIEKSHTVQHYLYFPSKKSAKRVAKILSEQGFTSGHRLSADNVNWLVLAVHQIVPTPEAVADARELCEQIAANYGGEYDGWEARLPARDNETL